MGKGQLSADQLAKFAQLLAPVAPKHPSFWIAFANRIRGKDYPDGLVGDLTETGKAVIEATFGDGAGPEFDEKDAFMKAVRGEKDEEKEPEKEPEKELEKENEVEVVEKEPEKESEKEPEKEPRKEDDKTDEPSGDDASPRKSKSPEKEDDASPRKRKKMEMRRGAREAAAEIRTRKKKRLSSSSKN